MCLKDTDLEELVFAIRTEELWNLLSYRESGLITGDYEDLNSIVRKGLFRKRSELEHDPSFKQIIPYAVISNEGSFLMFRRRSGQREKRLHDKLYLGSGGHMNPIGPCKPDEHYPVNELLRELFEEVELKEGCSIEKTEFIGFINDDSIPVGRVHIGLLYILHLSGKDVSIKETEKMSAAWTGKGELHGYWDELETWSRIALEYL